jgi:putative transposase
VIVAFIDDHREPFGVEPICRMLPIAPSTYERDPSRRSVRAQQDAILRAIIQRIWNEHDQVYGPRSGSRWAAKICERPDAGCGA